MQRRGWGGWFGAVGPDHPGSQGHGRGAKVVEINAENAIEAAQRVKAGDIPGPAKSLAEAVCRVMQAVSYVRKDKQMQGGGSYQYVSIEAIIDKLRPEMIRHGLVLLPVGLEPLHQGDHGRQVHLRLKYTFDLVHHHSGETRQIVVVGEGMDVGDKAGNKCMTAARKYALVMAFNIETGTDPDNTPSSSQERAPAQQRQQSQQSAPAGTPKDNLPLRGEALRAVTTCKSRKDMSDIMAAVKRDADDGQLSPVDLEVIKAAIQKWMAANPAKPTAAAN